MPRPHSKRLVRRLPCLRAARARVAKIASRLWHALWHWRRSVPVEVLIVNRARRRALERELRAALRRLERALGAPLPDDLAVVVQQIIKTDRQLAGCCQVGQRPAGGRFALIRLALQVNGRSLGVDELLAVLAEQCIGLAAQESGGPSVLIPVELEPTGPAETRHPRPLRPDPLAPHPNGSGSGDPLS